MNELELGLQYVSHFVIVHYHLLITTVTVLVAPCLRSERTASNVIYRSCSSRSDIRSDEIREPGLRRVGQSNLYSSTGRSFSAVMTSAQRTKRRRTGCRHAPLLKVEGPVHCRVTGSSQLVLWVIVLLSYNFVTYCATCEHLKCPYTQLTTAHQTTVFLVSLTCMSYS